MITNWITLSISLLSVSFFQPLAAQEKITQVEIVTDTTETTRKLLSQMDNQTFYKWVRSVGLNAEQKQFDFIPPPIPQFKDSFDLKLNIIDFNDTINIYLQLLRKSISDDSKVLAKITFSSPINQDKSARDSQILSSYNKQEYTDSLWWEFDKARKQNKIVQSPHNDGIDFNLKDPGYDDTSVRSMPKEIQFQVEKPVHHGTASTFNFNLGLLQMQNFAGPTTPVLRYDEMPDLNNAKTLNIGFDAMWGLNLFRGNVRFWYGLSYNFYNYRFQNNAIRIDPNQDQFKYRFADPNDPNEVNPEKSKLVSEYIGIPLAISFENSKWEASKLRLMIGVEGGYLMNAYTKVKYYDDRVTKNYDDFYLNEISVHPFFRFQWDNWALYGKYSISGLLRNSNAISIDPIAAGQKNMVMGMSFVIE